MAVHCTSPHGRRGFKRGLAQLHVESRGRQILTLFKVDEMVPFNDDYLETVRVLRAEYLDFVQEDTKR